MIDSVIYAPPLARPAVQPSNAKPATTLVDEQSMPVASAPISQRGPQNRLDSYLEVSQFVEQPAAAELISGIDIRV